MGQIQNTVDNISDHTGFSLQTAAILLINKIHEITLHGISYTLLIESTTNLVLVGPII